MEYTKINGIQFKEMLENGLNSLKINEKKINDLNVFPVPDGDTGSNMRLTLENGMIKANASSSIGAFMRELSRGMLLGARGNSGVILSQLFKGLSLVLHEYSEVDAKTFARGLVQAYITAYDAVVNPAEGTLLTVAREGIENIINDITVETTINELIDKYNESIKVSLEDTPNKLKILRDAGVVDSGGAGLLAIYDGINKYLKGEILEATEFEYQKAVVKTNTSVEFGYCTEFILQLDSNKALFDMNSLKQFLEANGNSIVLIEDDGYVKVHVHTLNPGAILNEAQKYGEFVTTKIENMSLQHEEFIANNEKKNIAYIAVSFGEGLKSLFLDFGCDLVIDSNASTEEFVKAYKKVNAKNIIVLPNNYNFYLAAKQASEMCDESKVYVLDTKSIADGYYALSMIDISDDRNVEKTVKQMKDGYNDVKTLYITQSIKNITNADNNIVEGDYVALIDKNITASSANVLDAIKSGLENIPEIEDKETIIIFKGINSNEDDLDEILSYIEDEYYNAQVGVIEAEQELYDYIIGIC